MSLVSYSKLTLLQQCVTAKSRNFSGLQKSHEILVVCSKDTIWQCPGENFPFLKEGKGLVVLLLVGLGLLEPW
jgi:hypothetical protein